MEADKIIKTKTGELELSILNHKPGINQNRFAALYYDCDCDYDAYMSKSGFLDFTVLHVKEDSSKIKLYPLYHIFGGGPGGMQDSYSEFVKPSIKEKIEYLLKNEFYEPYKSAEIIIETPGIHSRKQSKYPELDDDFAKLARLAYDLCGSSSESVMIHYFSLITGNPYKKLAEYTNNLLWANRTIGGKLGGDISSATGSREFTTWFALLMLELERKEK